MDNIVVTGASGFVGFNFLNSLPETIGVISIGRSKVNHPRVIQQLSWDELSKSEENSPIAYIHLAGKAHDLKKHTSKEEYYEVNRDLTISLYEQFKKSASAKKFIFLSSVKAAADSVEGSLTEDITPTPATDYGKSKREAEEHILQDALPDHQKAYILRPCMIHGPNNKGNLNLLFSFVNKGIPYPMGSFENQRSFLYVENLCAVFHHLIDSTISSGIYNVADDDTLSTNQLVKTIGESIDKKAKIWRLPKGLIHFIAKIGNVIKLPINSERVQKLTENYVVSNQKIKNALDLDLPYTTQEGIKKTIQSFKS